MLLSQKILDFYSLERILEMIKVPVLTTLLLQLLHILSEVSGQSSPCPQYFEYRTDPFTNEVRGYIQIPYPPRGIQLNLRVGLSIGVGLPSVNTAYFKTLLTLGLASENSLEGKILNLFKLKCIRNSVRFIREEQSASDKVHLIREK